MSDKPSLPFAAESGQPLKLVVTRKDGTQYEVRIQLSVFDVLETDNVAADGIPVFDVQMNVAMNVKRLEK